MEAYCFACGQPVEDGPIVFRGGVFCSFQCAWTVRPPGSEHPDSEVPARVTEPSGQSQWEVVARHAGRTAGIRVSNEKS